MAPENSAPPPPSGGGARPWLAHYPATADWHMPFPAETLVDIMEQAARAMPDRPSMSFLGRKWSYRQLAARVDQLAAGLQRSGVRPGSRVGLCLPNTPFAVISYYAVLRLGAVVVNFNPLSAAGTLATQIADSGTEIMITIDVQPLFQRVHGLLGAGCLRQIVLCRMHAALPFGKSLAWRVSRFRTRVPAGLAGVTEFAALLRQKQSSLPPRPAPHDLALLQYTGGTTGLPKGVELTHANLAANVRQVLAWQTMGARGQEVFIAVLPFFHVFGMTAVMNMAISVGAELQLLPRFHAKELLKTLRRGRTTVFHGVPTLYKAILDAGATARDLASVRFCISGGAPLPHEVKRDFEAIGGCRLIEGYGLTEASPVCFCGPIAGGDRPGTIGLPLPGVEAEIRDLQDPSRSLPTGARGELCVRGPNVMARYWNHPEDSASAMTPDGWLRTGDIGVMDQDGYVTLLDRLKDLIICSGFNVYPRTIEDAIYHHPDVVAVTALGMPDRYRGESPAAFVQLKPGSSLTVEELRAFLQEKLSPIEMPRRIEFRDHLPVTAVGKLSRTELRAEVFATPPPQE